MFVWSLYYYCCRTNESWIVLSSHHYKPASLNFTLQYTVLPSYYLIPWQAHILSHHFRPPDWILCLVPWHLIVWAVFEVVCPKNFLQSNGYWHRMRGPGTRHMMHTALRGQGRVAMYNDSIKKFLKNYKSYFNSSFLLIKNNNISVDARSIMEDLNVKHIGHNPDVQRLRVCV